MTAFAERIPGGGDGEVSWEYFPSPDLGIFGGAFLGKGRFYVSSDTIESRFVGFAGLASWIDATTVVDLEYALVSEDRPVVGTAQGGSLVLRETSHEITLAVGMRIA